MNAQELEELKSIIIRELAKAGDLEELKSMIEWAAYRITKG